MPVVHFIFNVIQDLGVIGGLAFIIQSIRRADTASRKRKQAEEYQSRLRSHGWTD